MTGAADTCLLDLVNLAFHEAGHLFLMPFGSTLHYLGGTLGQIAAPALLGAYFLVRGRQPLGAAFCAWWLGESVWNVSVYMGDARDWSLPLVGGGDHDWNELLYRFGLLDADSVAAVAGGTRAVGIAIMLAGLAWVLWFVLPLSARRRAAEALFSRVNPRRLRPNSGA